MENPKEGFKEFIITFVKAIVFIIFLFTVIYLFFVLADFIKVKFNIDIYVPGMIVGSIFIAFAFVLGWYRRIMNILGL